MGLMYLEPGSNFRPSHVYYDRAYSALSEMQPGMADWNTIFKNANWFHWTGITPALSQSAADTLKEAISVAKSKGIRNLLPADVVEMDSAADCDIHRQLFTECFAHSVRDCVLLVPGKGKGASSGRNCPKVGQFSSGHDKAPILAHGQCLHGYFKPSFSAKKAFVSIFSVLFLCHRRNLQRFRNFAAFLQRNFGH